MYMDYYCNSVARVISVANSCNILVSSAQDNYKTRDHANT